MYSFFSRRRVDGLLADMDASIASAVAEEESSVKLGRHYLLATLATAARTRRGSVGLVLLLVVVLTAGIGPWVAPYSSTALVTVPFGKPSSQFLLGGDDLGRDVLSRVLCGGWVLLVMAVVATVMGVVVGASAGIYAAYARGRLDGLIMRTVDVMLAFPPIIFALLLVSILGPQLWLIVLAVGISHAPQVARVLRGATLDVTERDFVKAAELQGLAPAAIIGKEILPNLVSPLMVETGIRLTYSVIIISGLAFLGLGQQPPSPSWGTMINENRIAMVANPWGVIVPAILIGILAIGINTFTDAVARVTIGIERRPEELGLVGNPLAEL
jgi:peptide/nickel transport system permease protein